MRLFSDHHCDALANGEDARLYREWQRTGDPALRERIVLSVCPWILRIAITMARRSGHDHTELFQAGVEGALVAFERFKPSKRVRFITYASYWVRESIGRHCASNRNQLSGSALRFGANQERANEARRLVRVIGLEDENGEDIGLSQADRDDDERIAADQRQAFAKDAVSEAMARLDDREALILRTRWLEWRDGKQVTLRELSRRLGVSHERVRQLEERGLRKMREALTTSSAAEGWRQA